MDEFMESDEEIDVTKFKKTLDEGEHIGELWQIVQSHRDALSDMTSLLSHGTDTFDKETKPSEPDMPKLYKTPEETVRPLVELRTGAAVAKGKLAHAQDQHKSFVSVLNRVVGRESFFSEESLASHLGSLFSSKSEDVLRKGVIGLAETHNRQVSRDRSSRPHV